MRPTIYHLLLSMALLCSTAANAITKSNLANYAKSLKGLKKAELKTRVHQLVGSPKVLSYGSGIDKTWWGFYYTDRDEQTGECINRYSSRKFYFPATNNGVAVSGMNIEHSFPKSWWGGSNNSAYKDLYNLYPSDTKANSSKSNFPMGIVETVKEESEGYDKVGKGTIDGVKGRDCWEPGAQYKGDFARAYMYMATAYQNLTWSGTQGNQQLENGDWPTLKPWAYKLYLKWLKADPVDQLEVKRNNAVAKIQLNRNLFVDYPYLAEYIWGDSIDVAFDPYSSVTTASDDTRYTGVPIIIDDDDDNPVDNPPVIDPDIDITAGDFAETFDQCKGTGGNDGNFGNASAAFKPDNEGWIAAASYGGLGCARFGSSNTIGNVTSPKFTINGTSLLSFKAAPYGSKDGTSLKLSVNGNATLSETQLTMKSGEWTTYTLTLTGQGQVSITFSPEKRLFLDDVIVASEKEKTIPGDVDGDGVVEIADVITLSSIVAGKAVADDYDAVAADLDEDGKLTITDIVRLIDLLLK